MLTPSDKWTAVRRQFCLDCARALHSALKSNLPNARESETFTGSRLIWHNGTVIIKSWVLIMRSNSSVIWQRSLSDNALPIWQSHNYSGVVLRTQSQPYSEALYSDNQINLYMIPKHRSLHELQHIVLLQYIHTYMQYMHIVTHMVPHITRPMWSYVCSCTLRSETESCWVLNILIKFPFTMNYLPYTYKNYMNEIIVSDTTVSIYYKFY